MGFEILGDTEGDKLFMDVKMPEGWKKVPTDHYMRSHVVDPNGVERMNVMYKPGFCDRDANMSINSRYWVGRHSEGSGDSYVSYSAVNDHGEGGRAIFHPHDRTYEGSRDECRAWLKEHYPEYKDKVAYWDD